MKTALLPRPFAGLAVLVAGGAVGALIAGAVFSHWRNERRAAHGAALEQLDAVASLKAAEVDTWRHERLGEARFLRRTPAVTQDVAALVARPDDPVARARLRGWLEPIKGGDRYESVLVFDAQARLLLAVPDSAAAANLPRPDRFAPALASGETVFTDMDRTAGAATSLLDVLVPIPPPLPASQAGEERVAVAPIAVVVLRLDPRHALFPLVQRWPLRSATAESLLGRQEGEELVFLSEFRHPPDPASPLRRSIPVPARPEAAGARVDVAGGEGRDYRGVAVLSTIRKIPDSPWSIVAKIDQAEVYAPLRRDAWQTGVSGGLLLLAVALAGAFGWRQRHTTFLRRALAAEQERNRAEAALRESEERFHNLLRDVPTVAVQGYGMDGTTRFWNQASEQLYGYTAAEAIGRNLLDLIIPSEMREGVRQAMQQMAETGQPIPASELSLRRKDGSRVAVFSSHAIVPIPGGAVELFCLDIDIGARQQAERELRESEARFRVLFEGAPDAILLADPASRKILDANAAACRLLARPRKEILALRQDELHPPQSCDYSKETFEEHVKESHDHGRTHPVENRVLRADGVEVPVEILAQIIRFGDQEVLVGTFRDITERKQTEELIRVSLREKEALLKEVHHRVKNNLQVIMSLLRLESGRTAQPDTRAVLSDMQGRIRSMALLHEKLYRSGTFAAVDLGAYLRQIAAQLFRALVDSPGAIRLELEVASVPIGMDQAVACGLLANELISNCLKHGFPDGRTGEVRVELQAVAGGPQWCLRVSDNGVGLPADFAAKRGQTLGLQLVSDLARQLDGRLEIGPGPGAVCEVFFIPSQLPTTPPGPPA